MRRFFFLQLCDSNTNNTQKIKFNTDLDCSTKKVSRTDSFNHNKFTKTLFLICHDLKDVDKSKNIAGIHHIIFLKFSFLDK